MASKEVEVLDPAATVEEDKETASRVALNRRYFMAALGVAGAAAGAALVSGPSTVHAQQPVPNGYSQTDILNFLMNLKYLKATLYSYLTQGTDLPTTALSTGAGGTGGIFNAPTKLTFSSAQITDMFNEMYYDELNQLLALRGLLGTAVAGRATLNLAGTGSTTVTSSAMTQNQAIGIARILEDVSVSAFAYATEYLSGTNLAYASQVLAANGFHAGAVRLVCIQNNIPYLSPQTVTTASAGTQTVNTFTGGLVTGSNTFFNLPPTNPIVVGSAVSGPGIPQGTVISAVTPAPAYTGSLNGSAAAPSNTITNLSTTAGLAVGQAISGTGIPTNSTIASISGTTLTLNFAVAPPAGGVGFNLAGAFVTAAATSAGITTTAAGVVLTVGFTAFTNKTNILSGVSSVAGLQIGQPITGVTGIPALTTITAIGANTITMSAAATVTFVVAPTGFVTKSSNVVTSVSSLNGVAIGQPITGTGIPANATVSAIDPVAGTITWLVAGAATGATLTSSATAAPTGVTTVGSPIITYLSSTSNLNPGQTITGTGIPANTLITSISSSSLIMTAPATISTNITTSATATAQGILTTGSPVLTGAGSITGTVANGYAVSGAGVPAGTIVTAVTTGNGTITLSNPATSSSVVTTAATATGTITASSPFITQMSSVTGIAVFQQIIGSNIALGVWVKAIDTVNNIVTMSSSAPTTFNIATETFTFTTTQTLNFFKTTALSSVNPVATEAVTIPTIEVITPALGSATLSNNAMSTGAVSLTMLTVDPQDVQPDDPGTIPFGGTVTNSSISVTAVSSFTGLAVGLLITGPGIPAGTTIATVNSATSTITLSNAATATTTAAALIAYPANAAALAAAGPSAVPGANAPLNQGFFNTAGSGTASANNPAGFAFARNFSQVLGALYGNTVPTDSAGGFFPSGVSSPINVV